MNEEILNYEMAHAIYVLIVCGVILTLYFIPLFICKPWKIEDKHEREMNRIHFISSFFAVLIIISVPVVMSINDIIKINVSPELFIADLNQFKGKK